MVFSDGFLFLVKELGFLTNPCSFTENLFAVKYCTRLKSTRERERGGGEGEEGGRRMERNKWMEIKRGRES
jgi:hypothetical protein